MKMRVLGPRRTDSDNSSDEGSSVMPINVESVPSGRRESIDQLDLESRRGSTAESVSESGSKQHSAARKMSSNSTRIEMDFGDEDADQVGELAAYRPGEHRKESEKSLSSSMLGLALMDSWQSHGGHAGSIKNRKKASIASTGSTSSRAPRFVLQPDEDDEPTPLATACSPTHIVFSRPGDSRRSSRALEEIEIKSIPQVDVHPAEDDDDW